MQTITIIPLVQGDTTHLVNQEDQAHFAATFNRAVQLAQGEQVEKVQIFLDTRTEPKLIQGHPITEGGWLEYTILVSYESGRSLTVGAIQRKPGMVSEFHS